MGNLRKEAQLRGVDPDRLIFARRVAGNDQHLGASARRPVPRYGAPLLASLKAKLAIRRKTRPLFDTQRFTRHIEAGFTTIWERHQRGESPVGVTVPASGPLKVVLLPKLFSHLKYVNLIFCPPVFFAPHLVKLPVVTAAQRHGEFIADFRPIARGWANRR